MKRKFRVITVFPVFRLLTDFVCLCTYEFWLSLLKIVRSSVILLLPLINHWRSTIPQISTKQAITSYPKSLNTKWPRHICRLRSRSCLGTGITCGGALLSLFVKYCFHFATFFLLWFNCRNNISSSLNNKNNKNVLLSSVCHLI